jgi:hypothetical protein
MLETAAWADHAGGASEVGRGEMRWCRALYANAEVEEAVDSDLSVWRVRKEVEGREMAARRGMERRAFREAIVAEYEISYDLYSIGLLDVFFSTPFFKIEVGDSIEDRSRKEKL